VWECYGSGETENSHTVIPKSFGFQADGKLTPATEGVWPPAPNPCGKKSVKGQASVLTSGANYFNGPKSEVLLLSAVLFC